ncbi:polyketide cyclase/dehydrase/lipid transport protein [Prauserella shujinwangii]|uniref:Polyketide cyclase/dehydrase/lipid transport protein n=1 Tax=Prauserella shujinwangii TaxID=1453103 RepID=A0A2T0M2B8_9PSEU|nr:SRPBCC family protein [Prauserella shujinwangii]PRX50898.1 polyketide cyclase/dehydrase/lipid transport protein [Prauserella shujinwangii]
MSSIQHSVEVDVPVATAYNQWTQFETFPHFADFLHQVLQRTDTQVHGTIDVEGRQHVFEIDLVEQRPDERIVWQTAHGPEHRAVVTFDALDDRHSRVTVGTSVPEAARETAGRLVERGLAGFKRYVESRGRESGAWRGSITSSSTPGGTALPRVSYGPPR